MEKEAALTLLNNDDVRVQRSLKKLFVEELEFKSTEKSDKFETNFKNFLLDLDSISHEAIPYDQVAQVMYQLDDDVIYNKTADDVIEMILKPEIAINIEKDGDHLSSTNIKLVKIYENILLAREQKNSLYSVLNKNVDDMSRSIMGLKGDSQRLELSYLNLKQGVDSFNANFVSVLGIFVAISFSLFSAAELIKGLFTISASPSPLEIGTKIMLAGIMVLMFYILIVGLLQGISTITKLYYYFSVRKLFIISAVCGGISLSGFLYGHSIFLLNQRHLISMGLCLLAYGILCMIIYSQGSKIKGYLIRKGKTKR